MRRALLLLTVAWGGCVDKGFFTCGTDDQCGAGGRCEATHACSFVDPTCTGSGRRYGDLSPSGLRDTCVAGEAADGGLPDASIADAPVSDASVTAIDATLATIDAAPTKIDAAAPKIDAAPIAGCVTAIAAGREEMLVLRTDGKMFGWGNNGYNQLDAFSQMPGPHAAANNLPPIAELGPGWDAGCVLGTDHTVWCFGGNYSGQSGNGTTVGPFLDATQTGGSGFLADHIAIGYYHGCALTGGQVDCWGENSSGQVGQAITLDDAGDDLRLLPVALATQPPSPSAIVSGGFHTCTLDSADGSVWCWGSDQENQLGDNKFIDSPTPVHAAGTANEVEIAGRSASVCARTASGQLTCWGDDTYNQIDMAGTITDAISVASGDDFTCVVRAGGELWCWGSNVFGEIAQPTSVTKKRMPTDTGFGGFTKVVAGDQFACGLKTDATVWCWGVNDNSELGVDPATTPGTNQPMSVTPVEVPLPCP